MCPCLKFPHKLFSFNRDGKYPVEFPLNGISKIKLTNMLRKSTSSDNTTLVIFSYFSLTAYNFSRFSKFCNFIERPLSSSRPLVWCCFLELFGLSELLGLSVHGCTFFSLWVSLNLVFLVCSTRKAIMKDTISNIKLRKI